MRLLTNLAIFMSISCTGFLGLFVYKLYSQQKIDQVLIENLRKQKRSISGSNLKQDQVSQYPVHESSTDFAEDYTGIKRQLWSGLQQKLRDCVVQVYCQKAEFNWIEPYKAPSQGESYGTAFFINSEGDLITNAHVIDQERHTSITIPSLGQRRFKVRVVGVSPERDLAKLALTPESKESVKRMLKRDSIPYLKLGDSDSVLRADKVMALGYPLGQRGLKSTTGVVSGREHVSGQYYIQTSAPLNPGNSGGPSINSQGQVIGVNSAGITSAQNIGYIIPSNEVNLFLKQLESIPEDEKFQDVKLLKKPFLGILFHSSNDHLAKFLNNPEPGGAYVVEVYKDSPLAKSGVQPGDMLYEINGHRIDSYGELYSDWSPEEKISIIDYVSRLMIGDKIHIVYYRNGQRKESVFVFDTTKLAPIHQKYPAYEKIDYEIIGGLVVMPLTLNHIFMLVKLVPELVQYADLKKRMEPVLLVTHVMINSQAAESRVIKPGMLLSEVNGQKVRTLDDFRKALCKSLDTNFLTLRTTENVFSVMPFDKIIEEEPRLARMCFYTPSNAVKDLIAKAKHKKASEKR